MSKFAIKKKIEDFKMIADTIKAQKYILKQVLKNHNPSTPFCQPLIQRVIKAREALPKFELTEYNKLSIDVKNDLIQYGVCVRCGGNITKRYYPKIGWEIGCKTCDTIYEMENVEGDAL